MIEPQVEIKDSQDHQEWLERFRQKHGRSPRILHVGNIANNAYNNVKLLNKAGLDCDVICYDYYHIMACPEWEDADFDGQIKDQVFPNWNFVNLRGFKRPKWFAQGPLKLCIRYLIAKRDNRKFHAWLLWNLIDLYRLLRSSSFYSPLIVIQNAIRNVIQNIFHLIARVFLLVMRVLLLPVRAIRKLRRLLLNEPSPSYLDDSSQVSLDSFDNRVAELVEIFANAYPTRQDKLSKSDLESYRVVMGDWQALFECYDLVQAYSTDPVLPMLAGGKPYIGFEHGTLRGFTLGDSAICRNTALGYRLADHVFITNGDCLEYAKAIGVSRFTPMLHPIDEQRIQGVQGDSQELRARLGVKYVFLCPLRHDWQVKGTDQYIRALPKLVEVIGKDFRVIMTRWGSQLQDSISLAKDLEVDELIEWVEPLNRCQLYRTIRSVDILFDQIMLPHFGATAPEGIAAHVPVIMSYDPQSTFWLIPEPAPILSAWNVEQIIEGVKRALEPDWLKEYRHNAQEWIDKYHNVNIVIQRHVEIYQKILSDK
ncbi:Glycosyl transferase family 1 domain-containing protein [Tumidithrix helvetica PCC 7403]|uniref:hypothetical protein n=1 Tax=Tumidithrix helvetica TaxID=3457545 RepID=UPI003CB00182